MTPLVAENALAPTGGAETQVLLLSRALAERGLAVCLVVFDVPDAAIPASVHGVDIVVRPPYLAGDLVGRLREIAAIRGIVAAVDASVYVTRTAGLHVGVLGFWTKLARRRFIYSSSGFRDFRYELILPTQRDRILFRLGLALADEIITQTKEQSAACSKRIGRMPLVIRNISEPAAETDQEPEAFLWIGRVDNNKRPLEFVHLARALPNARFRMVATDAPGASEGPRLWDALRHAAEGLPNFDLLPPQPRADVLRLIARSVAVVSTSEFEGMPNVFLEAWWRGVPALALSYDPDGIVLRHGLGGFANGRSDELVDLARQLWDNRHARHELAARCRSYVRRNHGAAAIAAEWARALGTEGHVLSPVAMEVR